MQLPDFLEAYTNKLQEYIDKGLIKDIAFSGPTYQVEIQDLKTDQSVWVFLQLGDDRVNDIFCSCDESQQKSACEHMAAACQFVFRRNKDPLHIRFVSSFWHELFLYMQKECGLKPCRIVKEGDTYSVRTHTGKLLFSASAKRNSKEILKNLLTDKEVETEETSIKFSNLTEEELELYRQGRPTLNLRFELSPLSSIAKWLFLMQEKAMLYEVQFHQGKENKLPEKLTINSEIDFEIPLEDELLNALIPTLKTVKSNLAVYLGQEGLLEKASFDKEKGSFELTFTAQEKDIKKRFERAFKFGKWHFLPKLGFYADTQKIEAKKSVSDPDSVSSFIETHLEFLKKELKGIVFHDEVKRLQYKLWFDEASSLHVEAYFLELHDLVSPFSHIYRDWIYIDGTGFFKIEKPKFSSGHLVIKKSELSSFLMHNRMWLSNFEGFQVFITKVEDEITYEVDQKGYLSFNVMLKKEFSKDKTIDLGEWVYKKGYGFYLKQPKDELRTLPVKQPIPSYLVPEFIRSHMPVLQNIPNFFLKDCPISKVGLNIALKKKGLIEILPEYSWISEKDKAKALFFDEYVYIRGKGFYCLPPNLRPLHYTKEIESSDTERWNNFFIELLPKLKSEYSTNIDPRLEPVDTLSLVASSVEKNNPQKGEIVEHELELHFKSNFIRITLPDVIQALTRGERFLPTQAGCIDLQLDRFHWLRALEKKRSKTKAKDKDESTYKLSALDFFRLKAFEDKVIIEAPYEQKAFLEKLLDLKPIEPPQFPDLQCSLRPYQLNGVAWLWFLYQNGLSGLLCDDMGVGKTHQAMGLMASVSHYNKSKGKKSLFLVICPTSLIYHWEDKIKRFLPHFRVKTYVGSNRSLDDFPGDYDLLLMSYGIWRNESKIFRNIFFDASFFDELQIAKNHVSQIYSALLQVQSRVKIGLTGTPIENQLRELKALFDLVLPGYMPEESDFREFFVKPIEKEDNPKKRALLGRYVRPFVLRRRKQDVLPDLPEKTEDISYAELIGEQKNLYKTVAQQQAFPIIQLLKDDSAPIPYMHIFALLAALKQICNHPAAYLRDVANYESYESGKWEAFVELLEEAEESNQKVVVFSQYLAMLDIIQAYLTKKKIGFAQIRGQTKLRGDEVERFHKDENCKVFLGSLQAAGLGIDLTPASIVIHYDRWWNAARENQATDRVHRIGQTRGVQVFKLMTKNTIEEKIDLMIQRKQSLLEDIVAFDDHQVMKRLTRSEILNLLESLGTE